MGEIKPIETYYNGYRFRSRLEARWAVFFDVLGVKYEYEPEGFELSDGEWYLPDFYLPQLNTYVEIKPKDAFEISFSDGYVSFPADQRIYGQATHDITKSEKCFLIAFGDPYDAFPVLPKQTKTRSYLFYHGICTVQAMFMRCEDQYAQEFTCTDKSGNERKCAECKDWDVGLTGSNVITIIPCSDGFAWVLAEEKSFPVYTHGIPFSWFVGSEKVDKELYQEAMGDWKKHFNAAVKARQARFEHGETPTI